MEDLEGWGLETSGWEERRIMMLVFDPEVRDAQVRALLAGRDRCEHPLKNTADAPGGQGTRLERT